MQCNLLHFNIFLTNNAVFPVWSLWACSHIGSLFRILRILIELFIVCSVWNFAKWIIIPTTLNSCVLDMWLDHYCFVTHDLGYAAIWLLTRCIAFYKHLFWRQNKESQIHVWRNNRQGAERRLVGKGKWRWGQALYSPIWRNNVSLRPCPLLTIRSEYPLSL